MFKKLFIPVFIFWCFASHLLYTTGFHGIEEFTIEIDNFPSATGLSSMPAHNLLMYANDESAGQDYEKAFHWFKKQRPGNMEMPNINRVFCI